MVIDKDAALAIARNLITYTRDFLLDADDTELRAVLEPQQYREWCLDRWRTLDLLEQFEQSVNNGQPDPDIYSLIEAKLHALGQLCEAAGV